jgi:tRNA-Thr(GGU) m(6)t(6)A37 methyltransferase TsaA
MIAMEPIGHVRTQRSAAEDDYWGGTEARIVLTDAVDPEALLGIEDFSHAEIIFWFDQVDPDKIVRGARHPRNNAAWPRVGIFAQRGKNRPNCIGSTIVRIVKHEGRVLHVLELDAIDGTPVLDIKPVMQEFLPRDPVRQPEWSHQLMRRYWSQDTGALPAGHGDV